MSSTPDLLLLDMMLGTGMSGEETYLQILKLRAGQRAILVSGYCDENKVASATAAGAHEFISKPWTIEQLGAAIQQALRSDVKSANTAGPGPASPSPNTREDPCVP